MKNAAFVTQSAREQSNFYVSARISTSLPTFAKLDETKLRKWKKSADNFQKEAISEELKSKLVQLKTLKEELCNICDEIRSNYSNIRRIAIIRILSSLRKSQFQSLMKTHAQKFFSLDLQESRRRQTYLTTYHPTTYHSSRNLSFAEDYNLQYLNKYLLERFKQASKRLIGNWNHSASIRLQERPCLYHLEIHCFKLHRKTQFNTCPPKALLQAINNLKRRDDIVITKPDKGSGVVVMGKADYVRLLCDASVRDSTKFTQCSTERQKARGRPFKYYHLLLEKENKLNIKVHSILPKSLADALCPKDSRLAHLYGLPKTHKPELSMRPILSAIGTYSYPLAKWLEEKLKPLSTTSYTISDIYQFSQDIRNTSIDVVHIMVSYDVTALFTNVPQCSRNHHNTCGENFQ